MKDFKLIADFSNKALLNIVLTVANEKFTPRKISSSAEHFKNDNKIY